MYIVFLGSVSSPWRKETFWSFSVSDNVKDWYAEEEPLGMKVAVNELQIHRHHVLLSQVHKSSPPPLNSILSGGSMKANQSDACVGKSPIDWHL